MQHLIQVFSAVVVRRAQHLTQSSVEAFGNAVALRYLGLGQPVFYAQCLAELVELMFAFDLASGKQPVYELFTIVRENELNVERSSIRTPSWKAFADAAFLDGSPDMATVESGKIVFTLVYATAISRWTSTISS